MNALKFNLGDAVAVEVSGEQGKVIGRAEYSTSEPNYLVRYKAADGRGVDGWWPESSLTAAETA